MRADRRSPVAQVWPGRASGAQLLLRAAIVAGGAGAVLCTRAAVGGSVDAIDIGLVLLAVLCAGMPDTHVGVVVIAAVGINWTARVDDPASAWVIGVAIGLALLHAAAAAASVAPLGASWTAAMARRWSRRFAVVAAVSVPVWVLVAALDRADIGSSPTLVTAALLTLAASALWLRSGVDPVDPNR